MKIELVDDWKQIVMRAHSMIAVFLGLLCINLPDIIFVLFDRDTDPRMWLIMGNILLVYGGAGRLIKQPTIAGGYDPTTLRSPWVITVFAVAAIAVVAMGQKSPNLSVDIAGVDDRPAQQVDNPDTAFLALAIPFVGQWEGLRLEAYLDIVGVPTVCYGETKGVQIGDNFTKAECDAMFARELVDYRDRLRPAFSAETLAARLPTPRDVAFASLAYNAGVSAISKSTAVRRLNAANVAGACEALTWWNKAGKRVVRGLVNRRAAERELCLRNA